MYISDDFFVINTQFIRLVHRRQESNPERPFAINVIYQDNSTINMQYAEIKNRDDMFLKLQNHLTIQRPAIK